MIPIEFFLLLGGILFIIGAYGALTKSNAILVLMCIELMLNAANINFVAFGAFNGDVMGQAFVVMTISVAAAEVAVGIAILLNAYKVRKTTELDDKQLQTMRW
ncbi:MAG: NADH-quinone oxidoreductase subunit NuoK [Candidatus Methanomethylophilaceae archaeon]|jgi:NADH-quinone oxidoreductase subunit K|nr:NADH-quinone oxidoreductase subunit NuoK [Thermoplasmata archaeon]MBQ3685458.1 NADH-quinone oxidoreductase subunit NuoK [Candidatus Methanomethylophilaceae archaeon]